MKLLHFLMFIPYYLLMLVKSNWAVAQSVLSPNYDFASPGIVAVDISLKSNIGLLMMVNLITMTPGTLSLDLSEDRKKLYIHAMHVESREALVRDINELENRLKKFLT